MSLFIKNLVASGGGKEILKGINLELEKGSIFALMGPNGSGKSTLAQVIMGNRDYELGSKSRLSGIPQAAGDYELRIDNKDILRLKTDERAREGLFLAFQNPIPIPGVSVANLLRTSHQLMNKKNRMEEKKLKRSHNPALSIWDFNMMLYKSAKKLGISDEMLRRSINEGFSGGERKKVEMLQAVVLNPKYAIFDEIDTGLDVDALKIVALAIKELKKNGAGILVITHYQRILRYAKPDQVGIMVNGRIVASGGKELAEEVEKKGYRKWVKS